jgi:hypothetical protein
MMPGREGDPPVIDFNPAAGSWPAGETHAIVDGLRERCPASLTTGYPRTPT